MKKRFGILFLMLSLFFWTPLSLNTARVSGAPLESWHYTASGSIESVAISADGNYIVAGTSDNYIHLFGKQSAMPLWSFSAGGTVNSVAISDDGNYIIAGDQDDYVYFFNKSITTPKLPIWNLTDSGAIQSVAISSDGRYAAALDLENVYCYDTSNVSSPKIWERFITIVISLAISANGKYIAVGDSLKTLNLFNTSDDVVPELWDYSIPAPSNFDINDVAISSDGEYIVIGGETHYIYMFNITEPSSPLWSFDMGDEVNSVDISSDGSYIVSGNAQGNFSLFHNSNSIPLWNHSVCDSIFSVAISADGNYALYGGNLSNVAMVYIFGRDNPYPIFSQAVDQNVIDLSVAISTNGRYVVVGTSGENYRVYLFEVYSVPGGIDWLLVGGIVLVVGGTAGGLAGVRRRLKKRGKRRKRFKLVSEPGIALTPIEILKEVGNKESLLMKFQEAKSAQSISPIKDVVLTPVSVSFVEKVGKLGLEPLELKEFLEEMLALPPIERTEIIDRMLLVSGGAS